MSIEEIRQRQWDFGLTVLTVALLASLGVQSFIGTIYVWWAERTVPAWEQVGYGTFVATMNAIAAPQLVALVVVMGLCVPKRLFRRGVLVAVSASMVAAGIVAAVATGSLATGLTLYLALAALIQVAVVVLTAAGAKGPSYLTEGRLTKLGSGLLHLGFIAFAIVFLTLNAWVYQPLLNMMETRKQKIAQGLEDARVAAEARANAEKEAAKIVADAQAEAGKVVREATERAATAGKDVKAAAEAEAAKAREAAMAEAELERNRILGDLRGQVAALAVAAANKLVGEALDEKKQHALLDEFFSGVKSGKVVVLDDAGFKGDSAEVTSALPLSKDEEAAVKKDVLAKVGAQAVSFRVDPSILGGLVIKVGDKVLDGSVAGKLEGLRQSLK